MTIYFPTWDKEILSLSGKPLDIPPDVAVCPYCQARLQVYVTGASQNDDLSWSVDCLEIDCESEPEIDSPDWEDWFAEHSDMPYVYMLPIDVKIQRWINGRYRIRD